MKIVTEKLLENYAMCPLRIDTVRNDLEAAAQQTLDWYILSLFIGKSPNIHDTQSMFENTLKSKKWTAAEIRSKAINGCRVLSKRLDTIFNSHKVLQPTSPYHLMLEGDNILGSYAIIENYRSRRRFVLRSWKEIDQGLHKQPDVISMARWLHYITQEEDPVSIYHVGLLDPKVRGNTTYHQEFNEDVVRMQLGGILKSIRHGCYYPSPGTYCKTCLGMPCLETIQHGK